MRIDIKDALKLFTLFVLLALTGCDGGGGGGGGGGASPSNNDAFSLSTSSVSFAGNQGENQPPKTVGVTVNRGTVFIEVTADGGLVTATFNTTSPSTGVVTIFIPSASLTAPGTHTGTVTVRGCTNGGCSQGSDVAGSPKVINVTFTVGADLAVSATVTNVTYAAGSPNPARQPIQVVAPIGVSWIASSNQPWLGLSANSGIGPSTVNYIVNPSGLGTGTYNGTLTFTTPSSGRSATLSVTLNVIAPAIAAGTGLLTFTGISGVSVPSQTVNLAMNNGTLVNWSATSNSAWLVINPTSGRTPSVMTVGINSSGLSAGTYAAAITITGTGIGAPTTLNV